MSRIDLQSLDTSETDDAIEAVNKKDSTDPQDVAQVRDYTEYLREMQDTDDETSTDEISSDADNSGATEPDSSEGNDQPKDESSSDETTDNSKDAVDPDFNEVKEFSDRTEDAEAALEAINTLLDIRQFLYKELTTKGYSKTKDYLAKVNRLKSLESFSLYKEKILPVQTSLESIALATKALDPSQLRTSMEGMLEWIKDAFESLINFIASIIKWIKDFFFGSEHDKREEKIKAESSRKESENLAKKEKELSDYKEDILEQLEKANIAGTQALATGYEDNSVDDLIKSIGSTQATLISFWKYNQAYIENVIAKDFSEVVRFVKYRVVSASINQKLDGYLDINAGNYQPPGIGRITNTAGWSVSSNMPNTFSLYVIQTLLCGNVYLGFEIPDASPATGKVHPYGSYKFSFYKSTDKRDNISVKPTAVPAKLAQLGQVMLNAYTTRNEVGKYVKTVIKSLEQNTNALKDMLKTLPSKLLTPYQVKIHQDRLGYNIHLFNTVFDKPLIATTVYYDRLIKHTRSYIDSNNKLLQQAMEKIEKKVKDKQ